jgi:hypothetical protein
MTDAPQQNGSDDLLAVLEKGVRDILKAKKSSKADRLSAINAGTRLLAIRHKINGGAEDEGFFK